MSHTHFGLFCFLFTTYYYEQSRLWDLPGRRLSFLPPCHLAILPKKLNSPLGGVEKLCLMATIDQFFKSREREDDILKIDSSSGSWAWDNKKERESESDFFALCDSLRYRGEVPQGTTITTQKSVYTAHEEGWLKSKK